VCIIRTARSPISKTNKRNDENYNTAAAATTTTAAATTVRRDRQKREKKNMVDRRVPDYIDINSRKLPAK